jgi:hypothetical protein
MPRALWRRCRLWKISRYLKMALASSMRVRQRCRSSSSTCTRDHNDTGHGGSKAGADAAHGGQQPDAFARWLNAHEVNCPGSRGQCDGPDLERAGAGRSPYLRRPGPVRCAGGRPWTSRRSGGRTHPARPRGTTSLNGLCRAGRAWRRLSQPRAWTPVVSVALRSICGVGGQSRVPPDTADFACCRQSAAHVPASGLESSESSGAAGNRGGRLVRCSAPSTVH